jgi:hypothetical protein
MAWRAWTCRIYDLPVSLQLLCSPVGRRGWPDVVAWKETARAREVRFVEYKDLNDSINENQNAWFRVVLDRGKMDRESYVVAEWKPNEAQKLMVTEQEAWRT